MTYPQSGFQGRIGVARRDITPPAGIYARSWGAAAHDVADGVHCPLTLTCLTLQTSRDAAPLVLIGADLGWWKSRADEAFVRGGVVEADLRQMRRGVELEDGTAKAVAARLLDTNDRGTWVQVILVEGRKRQVRRMLDALGYYVVRLLRVRFGPIRLGELPPGRWGYMTEREVAVLKNVAGLVK